MKHKLVSFTIVVALWTLVTLLSNKANMHTFEVEIRRLQKVCRFGRYDAKAKLFCQKSFVPVTRAGVFIWENFHPGYRDLGNRASPASHMNTSKF